MLKLSVTVTVFSLAFGGVGFAETQVRPENLDQNYFTISRIHREITPLPENEDTEKDLANVQKLMTQNASLETKVFESLPGMNSPEIHAPSTSSGGGLAIMEILLKVWDIIEKNKPVVNVENQFASALPEISKNHWEKLVGWKPERAFKVNVSYENLYGMNAVELEYHVKLLYGGRVDGKGLYIASARVVPTKIKALWGYNLNVQVKIPSVLNIGSEADPLASIQLDVNWTVKNLLKHETITETYQVQGNGLMMDTKTGEVIFKPQL